MWRGDAPTQRNPMELVTIKGASKRTRQPRSLTAEEFQKLAKQLEEPFHTIALVCQVVDDMKTPESSRAMHIDAAMLEGLKD